MFCFHLYFNISNVIIALRNTIWYFKFRIVMKTEFRFEVKSQETTYCGVYLRYLLSTNFNWSVCCFFFLSLFKNLVFLCRNSRCTCKVLHVGRWVRCVTLDLSSFTRRRKVSFSIPNTWSLSLKEALLFGQPIQLRLMTLRSRSRSRSRSRGT